MQVISARRSSCSGANALPFAPSCVRTGVCLLILAIGVSSLLFSLHIRHGQKEMPAGERSRPHMTCSTTELQAPNHSRRVLDLTGFEPATTRLRGEVSVLFTTG